MSANETHTLRLEGGATIDDAAALKERMTVALDRGEPLALDLSAVTEIDTSGLQLLIAAGAAARVRGGALELAEVSEPVREIFAAYGLGAHLEAPAEEGEQTR